MTTLHRAIAIQGIGSQHPDIALQGYRFSDVVSPPPPTDAPVTIRFAPYTQAFVKRAYAENRVSVWQAEAEATPLWVDQTSVNPYAYPITINAVTHMTHFYIKKGDTLPRIESLLKYSDGRSVNLKDAVSVQLIYRPTTGGASITKTGTIIDAAQGKVAYQWVSGDTAIPGDYVAEWRITFPGGGKLTIPNNGSFIEFKISPTLTEA